LALILVLPGCPDDEPEVVVGADLCAGLGPGCEAPRDPALDRAAPCSFSQVIALAPPGEACPVFPRGEEDAAPWRGGPLFAFTVNDAPVDGLPRPDDDDGEARFCRYVYTGEGTPADAEVDVLRGEMSLARVETDCSVSGGMGLFETLGPDLLATGDRMSGALPLGPLPSLGFDGGERLPAPVRVAVVDTAADGPVQWGPGVSDGTNSPHGRDMARIIQRLACPECAQQPAGGGVELTNHPGLDLVWDGGQIVAQSTGGYFGYQGTVALRVYEAFARWYTDHPEPRPPLVINLSIGWEPGFNDEEDDRSLRASAVYEAIELAVRHGALVIASAGNRGVGPTTGRDRPGPSWPAALEAEPAPGGGAPGYAPLVHAIGGLDGLDEPLEKTRPQSMPRLASYAFFAVAPNVAGQDLSGPYTGTSVAAATASAAAALVWRYRPELTAAEVMQVVYDSAVEVAGPAAFCNPSASPCPATRRVSVCGAARAAIEHVCAQEPEPAGCAEAAVECVGIEAAMGHNPSFPTMPPSVAPEEIEAGMLGEVEQKVANCDAPIIAGDTAGEDPCPEQQHFGAGHAPWAVWPQPSNPGCHVCALSESTGTLWYEPGAWPDKLTSPKLKVATAAGVKAYDLSIGSATSGLVGGQLYKFGGLSLPGGIKSAKVTFTTIGTTGKKIAGSDQLILY